MAAWFETLGVVILAGVGIALGAFFSRLRKHYWCGFTFAFVLIGMLLIARFCPKATFVPPFYWIAMGRTQFVVLTLAATIGVTSCISRLRYRFEKVGACILMMMVVVWFGILPFLVPALIKKDLSSLVTKMSSEGICFQTTDFTCGPAAAVTALRVLGLQADEGEIAVLSHSSPLTGTLPSCLSAALERRYRDEGLTCQYRYFDSLNQLQEGQITLAVIRSALLLNHCVAILEVTDDIVTIADPQLGRTSFQRRSFEEIWRFCGIVLERDSAPQS